MTEPIDYDVVVVGAGPSGSTAAKTIAEHDVNVLLVDKEPFPRNKPCGGGLPIRTIDRFPYLQNLHSVQTYSFGGSVCLSSTNFKTDILKSDPVLAMVDRSEFDYDLVSLAVDNGAEFLDNKTVKNIKNESKHVILHFEDETQIKTELVIGADGVHSTLNKHLGLRLRKIAKGICLLEEFPLEKKVIDEYFTSNYLCCIHSKFDGIRGYGWVFPKKNNVNVGIISYDDIHKLKQEKGSLNHIFKKYVDFLKSEHIIPKSVESCNMRGGCVPGQPLSKTYSDRVLFCGDAAGLINPISGEGIYYALVSGEFAGETAVDAIKNHDTSEHFLSSYEKKWKNDFGKEIKIFLRSKRQWGKQSGRMIQMMNIDPKFAEMIFLIMVGKKSVYDLRWKIIKRFLINKLTFKVK